MVGGRLWKPLKRGAGGKRLRTTEANWSVQACPNSSDNQSWGDKVQLLLFVSDREFEFIIRKE